MKQILERLTANRFLGVFVEPESLLSSSPHPPQATVMVGFVNSQLMTPSKQAVWIIMGANIGTTVTGQLIALDIRAIAPLIAFAGVALILLSNRKGPVCRWYYCRSGYPLLGMGMMSAAMIPLRDSQHFVNLMTKFSNPFSGYSGRSSFYCYHTVLFCICWYPSGFGCKRINRLDSAVFVLFGQNIGTCITAVLASIGANRDAKRTTLIHLIFNVIGTTVFTLICLVSPLHSGWPRSHRTIPRRRIANVHTLFNIITTLLLLPSAQLARISEKASA